MKFYDFYPTVSFTIVDGYSLKVDYILPHTNVEERPIVEYQKSVSGEKTTFTVFDEFYNSVWTEAISDL